MTKDETLENDVKVLSFYAIVGTLLFIVTEFDEIVAFFRGLFNL